MPIDANALICQIYSKKSSYLAQPVILPKPLPYFQRYLIVMQYNRIPKLTIRRVLSELQTMPKETQERARVLTDLARGTTLRSGRVP